MEMVFIFRNNLMLVSRGARGDSDNMSGWQLLCLIFDVSIIFLIQS